MKNVAPAVALLAGTALAGQAPSGVEAAGKHHPGGRGEIHIVPVNPMIIPDEDVEKHVDDLVNMPDDKLMETLATVYKDDMKPDEAVVFPKGSVEAMQKRIKDKTRGDEEQQAVTEAMNRYALFLGNMLQQYSVYNAVKSELASANPKEYKDLMNRVPTVVDSLEKESMMLVTYLRKAANGLRAKSSMTRVQGVVKFISDLVAMYETNHMLLHMDVELTKMRFKVDKAEPMDTLQKERAYTVTQSQYSVLSTEYQRKAEQAKASAASSVSDGVLNADYLTLVA